MADLSHVPPGSQIHQMFGPGAGVAPELPEVAMPDIPERPRAEYDEGAVRRRTQEEAAPGIRTLREAYQTAASRLPSDPRSRLTLKEALKGYGTGLESVMGGAKRRATAEERERVRMEETAIGQEYAAQVGMLQQQMQTQAQAQLQQFQMSYADYLSSPQSQGGGYYTGASGRHATWVEPYTIY